MDEKVETVKESMFSFVFNVVVSKETKELITAEDATFVPEIFKYLPSLKIFFHHVIGSVLARDAVL